jgi:hypothetical protein
LSTHFGSWRYRFSAAVAGQRPVKLVDKGSLSSFGLSNAFQADAAASAKLKPDFHHLNAGKLVEQLPRSQ